MVSAYLTLLLLTNALLWGRAGGLLSAYLGPLSVRAVVDPWSLRFYSLLGLISGSVVCWAYYYMDGEPYFRRFLGVVIMFVGCMVILVFMNTLYGALVGWDGLGITSFLLVIYYKNRKALGRGIVTALTNRLGDAFLLVLLGLAFLPIPATYALQILLLLTAMTKSAQYPFRRWLPAAMAAPTPVRALVHSSTLVTAGVYLLLRFNHRGTEWLLAIGSTTMLMAGLCACGEIDIKKIVALRTLSQLGVIVVGLGLALKSLRFFHLMTHALFKALLFLCVGVGIHTVFGTQDLRRFSNASSTLPGPRSFLSVANLALLGFPFLAGFYSKDAILEGFYSASQSLRGLVAFLLGVGLTTAYRLKLTRLALLGSLDPAPATLNGGGTPPWVKMPLLVLGVASVLGGFLLSPHLATGMTTVCVSDKLLPMACIALGGGVGWRLSNVKVSFFNRIWDLTPGAQNLAGAGPGIRSAWLVDAGTGEIARGPGWLRLYLYSQLSLYPALSLALLGTRILLV